MDDADDDEDHREIVQVMPMTKFRSKRDASCFSVLFVR